MKLTTKVVSRVQITKIFEIGALEGVSSPWTLWPPVDVFWNKMQNERMVSRWQPWESSECEHRWQHAQWVPAPKFASVWSEPPGWSAQSFTRSAVRPHFLTQFRFVWSSNPFPALWQFSKFEIESLELQFVNKTILCNFFRNMQIFPKYSFFSEICKIFRNMQNFPKYANFSKICKLIQNMQIQFGHNSIS